MQVNKQNVKHRKGKSKRGKNPKSKLDDEIETIQKLYTDINEDAINAFNDLPLSGPTKRGLSESNYEQPTEIQKKTIKLALSGCDILGASETGSGKTLAFLIPIIEKLYCEKWSAMDGTGAIVITPTRELAYQIFEMLKKIGRFHDFSAGLIIGGKDLKFERKRMDQCNIVICTPGRLLQHMDENPLFNCDNLQVLVFDEADRCLDMGFADDINAIIANIPPTRQTFLFSATQTKSVTDLIRLSLKDPKYVSVNNDRFSTPTKLTQIYTVCELHEKIAVLWSFLKNHLKSKMIIFFATCKESKFVQGVFLKLRPYLPLLLLHGGLHQDKRFQVYDRFCSERNAALFCTDIAARGLDFPNVNWVVQFDCPEDPETYIHRVGRTARYHRGGEAFLMILPTELKMVEKLEKIHIPIEKVDVSMDKMVNPVKKLEMFLAKYTELKEMAQLAFKAYFKSIYLMKDKEVFDAFALNANEFAHSLGLAVPPRIRFLEKKCKAKANNKDEEDYSYLDKLKENEDDDEDDTFIEKDSIGKKSKVRENDEKKKMVNNNETNAFYASDESDDDLITIKRKDHDIEMPDEPLPQTTSKKAAKIKTKAAIAKKLIRKNIVSNKRIVFDDDGEAVAEPTKEKRSVIAQEYEKADDEEGGINLEKAKEVLQEEDVFDRELYREKVKAKKREAKKKLKQQLEEEANDDGSETEGVQWGGHQKDEDDFGSDDDDDGEEPDLSWLPDPDKIYGEKNQDESSDEFYEKSDKEEEQLVKTKKKGKKAMALAAVKRKAGTTKLKGKSKKEKKLKLDEGLSIQDTEELAKMFLSNV